MIILIKKKERKETNIISSLQARQIRNPKLNSGKF